MSPGPPNERMKPFPFEKLPANIQSGIFRTWLHFDGQLVHALSRLDHFVVPETLPTDKELKAQSGLPNRFFISSEEPANCSITHDTSSPNELLRVLNVSKRWLFLGVHAFYGLNTFAFSSLGEFSRFMRGIGPRRVQYACLTIPRFTC